MIRPSARTIANPFLAVFASVAALLAGCIFEKEARGGHVVENEVAGTIFGQDGKPAAGATVKAYPVDHAPNDGLFKRSADTAFIHSFVTDADGRYFVQGLPEGQYNFLGERDGALSYQDSVVVDEGTDSIPADTLKPPGSVVGRVILQPNHSPLMVFVQVLGTDHFVNLDSSGHFTLGPLAQGRYAVRISATSKEYPPYFFGISVVSGRIDTLAEPIRLPFTGIPVVQGLEAAFDTAKGTVRLSWRRTAFPFFKEYLIYRTEASSPVPSSLPIARVRDTAYLDDLSAFATGKWPLSVPPKGFEYRVKIRNLSEEEGASFGSVEVLAVPTAAVRTTIRLRGRVEGAGIVGSVGDSVRVVADWENPTRANDSLEWILESGTSLRRIPIRGGKGEDTLHLRLPATPGRTLLNARIRDASGDVWTASITLDALRDPPVANAGRDTLLAVRDTLRLRGAGTDAYGRITGWEWDVGARGAFTPVRDTLISLGGEPGTLLNVLRVTDDDGNSATDTMRITVILDPPVADAGMDTTVTVNDTLRLRGTGMDGKGVIVKREWDIGGTGNFVEYPTGEAMVRADSIASVGIHVFRVTDNSGQTDRDTVKSIAVDDVPQITLRSATRSKSEGGGYRLLATVTDRGRIERWEWDFGDGLGLRPGTGPEIAFVPSQPGGSLILCRVRATDEDGNFAEKQVEITVSKWLDLGLPPVPMGGSGNLEMAELGGSIYVVGGSEGEGRPLGLNYRYDTATGQWKTLKPLRHPREDFALVACGTKLYVLGGRSGTDGNIPYSVYEYDPAIDEWLQKANMPSYGGQGLSAGTVGGRIFIPGGTNWSAGALEYDPATESWTPRASPPSELSVSGVHSLGNATYVVAPRHAKVFKHDTSLDLWSMAAQIPEYPWDQVATCSAGGRLYMLGNTLKTDRAVQAYDPGSGNWIPRSPQLFRSLGCAQAGGKLYAVGERGRLQIFDPSLDP